MKQKYSVMISFEFTAKDYQEIIDRLDILNGKVSKSSIVDFQSLVYDNSDALKILKVSRRTLQGWRSQGLISFSQVGAKIYYTPENIDDFIKDHYVKKF